MQGALTYASILRHFSTVSFRILHLIYLELIFVLGEKLGSTFILRVGIQFVEETIFSPMYIVNIFMRCINIYISHL